MRWGEDESLPHLRNGPLAETAGYPWCTARLFSGAPGRLRKAWLNVVRANLILSL